MRFSIIIPTRNRAALLDRCLAAIGALEYPRNDFEVLVIDDASDIAPTDVIDRHSSSLILRFFHSDGHGPARARNFGLNEARGEYVVFTDDDCAPQPQWLNAFDLAFRSDPAAAFGGQITNAPENNVCGRASQMLVTFLYSCFDLHPDLKFFCSNNLAFPRCELLHLGGFDETFPLAAGEDRELCARWQQKYQLHFLAAAVVQHRQVLGILSFALQHFRYGIGAAHFWGKQNVAGEPGVCIKPVHFYWRMLTLPFTMANTPQPFTFLLLIGLSQVANGAGYLAGRVQPRAKVPVPQR